jgi:hypothetical protein
MTCDYEFDLFLLLFMQILIGAFLYCVISVLFTLLFLLFVVVSVSVVFLFLASACKVNYDPSAGIDSDCSDVPGYLPSMLQKPEDVPSILEETVTVEVSSC